MKDKHKEALLLVIDRINEKFEEEGLNVSLEGERLLWTSWVSFNGITVWTDEKNDDLDYIQDDNLIEYFTKSIVDGIRHHQTSVENVLSLLGEIS